MSCNPKAYPNFLAAPRPGPAPPEPLETSGGLRMRQ